MAITAPAAAVLCKMVHGYWKGFLAQPVNSENVALHLKIRTKIQKVEIIRNFALRIEG